MQPPPAHPAPCTREMHFPRLLRPTPFSRFRHRSYRILSENVDKLYFFVMSGVGCTARSVRVRCIPWRTRAFGFASRGRLSRAPPLGPRINSVGRGGRGGAAPARPQRPPTHAGRCRTSGPCRTHAGRRTPDTDETRTFQDVIALRRVSYRRPITRALTIYCGVTSWKDFRLHCIQFAYSSQSRNTKQVSNRKLF